MGIINSAKEVNSSAVACGGSFDITLSLTAAPDIVSNPTDNRPICRDVTVRCIKFVLPE